MRIPSELYRPSLALLTDLYQLTMAYAYWKSGMERLEAAFHLFFRRNPFKGGFIVPLDDDTIGNIQEIRGTISEAGDDYFIVTDARNRQWTNLGYEHVLKVVGFSTPLETARSFERVLLLVKPGDKITVLDSSGRFSKGKIAELSPSSLRLFVNRTVHDFPADQIREIIQRRSDHLGLTKGVVIGSGIGLGLTILAVAGGCGECVRRWARANSATASTSPGSTSVRP